MLKCTDVLLKKLLELSYILEKKNMFVFHQIGLKFEEETNKMLHLEHGFVWC